MSRVVEPTVEVQAAVADGPGEILPFPASAQRYSVPEKISRLAEALSQHKASNDELDRLEAIIAMATDSIGEDYPCDGITYVSPTPAWRFPDLLIRLERSGGVFTAELIGASLIARHDPAPPRPAPDRRGTLRVTATS